MKHFIRVFHSMFVIIFTTSSTLYRFLGPVTQYFISKHTSRKNIYFNTAEKCLLVSRISDFNQRTTDLAQSYFIFKSLSKRNHTHLYQSFKTILILVVLHVNYFQEIHDHTFSNFEWILVVGEATKTKNFMTPRYSSLINSCNSFK